MNKMIGLMFALCFCVGCHCTTGAPATRTAEGLLRHFPSTQKTVQAFYGHNFMVGDTPVIPTESVPKEMLLKLVGKKVVAKGVWYPGKEWASKNQDEQAAVPLEAAKGPVILGDGIKLQTISPK